MINVPKELLDLRQIYYFSVVAEELSLHRAAERLFISQPPLSRQIKQFEERLGSTLFVRHTRGVTLTKEGAKILENLRPLLAVHDEVLRQLRAHGTSSKKRMTIGFTTAFEQGIFSALEAELRSRFGTETRIVRMPSPRLVRAVKSGKVNLAFVAMPLEIHGLSVLPLGYAEPHIAALPTDWPEAQKSQISLADLQGKPVFWFRRELNPAFYDFTRSIFTQAQFAPIFQEEHVEHDVLLARVAAGEGAALLPASFAVVHRDGVVYKELPHNGELRIQLGILADASKETLMHDILDTVLRIPPCA